MDILSLWKLVQGIGIQKVVKSVSFLAWLVLPFWFWLIVLGFVGKGAFLLPAAIPGIIYLLLELSVSSSQVYVISGYEFRIMRIIGKMGEVFRDPQNKKLTEDFKNECRKSALPLTHEMPLALSGLTGMFQSTIAMFVTLPAALYTSYSLMTLIVALQHGIANLFYPLVSYGSELLSSNLINWPFENLWFSLIIIWILSLYYDPFVKLARQAGQLAIGKKRLVPLYILSLFNLFSRIFICMIYIVEIPASFSKQRRVAKYKPFIDPLTLPNIIHKMMQNAEGKSCDVSRWSEKINAVSDVDKIKALIRKDKNFPLLFKLIVKASRSEETLRRIKQTEPMTYLGIHSNRCVFIGTISYNPIERVRVASFYFDTIHLREEFTRIYAKEVEKQRGLEKQLPQEIEKLLENIGEQ